MTEHNEKPPLVWFVGAGPGDPSLLTLKGKALLERAAVIIYAGSLVNPELLKFARKDAAIYDSAGMTLEEIVAVMSRATREGKEVVRLHTGDPSLYGAIDEQMAALRNAGIPYAAVPGVSSLFAAAAALQCEYTLPEITQTLIVTRCAGRTAVPEGERLSALAVHGASLAVFLSAGLIQEVEAELLEGGLDRETPAAIVYKASWPDEKIVRGTVGTLTKMAEDAGINKTALILAGRFLDGGKIPSRLYDAGFSHEFRDASIQNNDLGVFLPPQAEAKTALSAPMLKIRKSADFERFPLQSLTRERTSDIDRTSLVPLAIIAVSRAGAELAGKLTSAFPGAAAYVYRPHALPGQKPFERVPDITETLWKKTRGFLFIAAAGIAVRAIAPLVRSKYEDPAVVQCADNGAFVVSLLSGHEGGANELAQRIAEALGTLPVLTTASEASPAVLPRNLTLGLGCRRGTGAAALARAVETVFAEHRLSPLRIKTIASIDLKKDEAGLLELADELGVPCRFYSSEELAAVDGDFSGSEFVEKTTGVDNVCERAAVLASGGGKLLVKKQAAEGVAVAVAETALPETAAEAVK